MSKRRHSMIWDEEDVRAEFPAIVLTLSIIAGVILGLVAGAFHA